MAKRILIVEDTQSIAGLFNRIIEKSGFTVETAGDHGEAGEKISSFNPDLIILDIMLGEVTGIQYALKLREGGLDTPILFVTALDDAEVHAAARRVGQGLLKKPFSQEDLLAKINQLLE